MPIKLEARGVPQAVNYLVDVLPANVEQGTRANLSLAATKIQSMVQNRIGGGGPLRNISGALRSSIQTSQQGLNLQTFRYTVHSGSVYAPTHEVGATIRAKRAYASVPGGPYLNIPIGPNRLDSGATWKQAAEVFAEGGYIIQSRKGNWIVMLNGEPMFLLRKQVTIPPRLGMMTAADDGFNASEIELQQLMIRFRIFPLE